MKQLPLLLAADPATAAAATPAGGEPDASLLLGVGDWAAIVLLLIGTVFSMLAAVGILRMPDLFTRMQAAAKAGTLGVSCLILAAAAHFMGRPGGLATTAETILILTFIFLTTPAAAHLIGRAAYFVNVPIWERTQHDDLRGCYTAEHGLMAPDDSFVRTWDPEIGVVMSPDEDKQEPPRATGT